MKLTKTRQRGYTFDEMMKRLRDSGRFHEFLRTAADTGLLAFDTALVTALTPDEHRRVKAVARKTPQLGDFDPLPIRQAFPTAFGPQVEAAEPHAVPDLDEFSFFRLTGGGREAVVQARHFLTIVKRHPDATAHFRAGPANWRAPVTFLEWDSPVALIMPVNPKDKA